MPTKQLTVKDLPELVTREPFKGPKPILACQGECGGEFSASRGDYWNVPEDTFMTCCGKPMILVTKHTIYRPYKIQATASTR